MSQLAHTLSLCFRCCFCLTFFSLGDHPTHTHTQSSVGGDEKHSFGFSSHFFSSWSHDWCCVIKHNKKLWGDMATPSLSMSRSLSHAT